MAGGLSGFFGPLIGKFPLEAERVAASAVVGGTAAELGGGKFANGAVTAAFLRLYNEESQGEVDRSKPIYGTVDRVKGFVQLRFLNDTDWFRPQLGIQIDLTKVLIITGEDSQIWFKLENCKLFPIGSTMTFTLAPPKIDLGSGSHLLAPSRSSMMPSHYFWPPYPNQQPTPIPTIPPYLRRPSDFEFVWPPRR